MQSKFDLASCLCGICMAVLQLHIYVHTYVRTYKCLLLANSQNGWMDEKNLPKWDRISQIFISHASKRLQRHYGQGQMCSCCLWQCQNDRKPTYGWHCTYFHFRLLSPPTDSIQQSFKATNTASSEIFSGFSSDSQMCSAKPTHSLTHLLAWVADWQEVWSFVVKLTLNKEGRGHLCYHYYQSIIVIIIIIIQARSTARTNIESEEKGRT